MIASYLIGDTSKTNNKFLYVEQVPSLRYSKSSVFQVP